MFRRIYSYYQKVSMTIYQGSRYVAEIEETFQIEITDEDYEKIQTVGDIWYYISKG